MGYYPVYPLKPCFHAQIGILLLSWGSMPMQRHASWRRDSYNTSCHCRPQGTIRLIKSVPVVSHAAFFFPRHDAAPVFFLEGRSLGVHVLAETSSPPRRTPCCRAHKLVLDLASNYRAPYSQVPLSWHRGSRLLLSTARRWPAAGEGGPREPELEAIGAGRPSQP
jgi:hypothetical protein